MTARQKRDLKMVTPLTIPFLIVWGLMAVGILFPWTGWGENIHLFMESPVVYGVNGRQLGATVLFLIGTGTFGLVVYRSIRILPQTNG